MFPYIHFKRASFILLLKRTKKKYTALKRVSYHHLHTILHDNYIIYESSNILASCTVFHKRWLHFLFHIVK